MIKELLEERIRQFAPGDVLEQENVLKELMQECILVSLSRTGLFANAVFHGGTCLKIFYGLQRFSEDLDFFLNDPHVNFSWNDCLEVVRRDLEEMGVHFEAIDRSKADQAVKKAFLKTDSVGTVLLLDLPFERNLRRKIRVRLEIDTNPPGRSRLETHFLTFPAAAAITTQTLEAGFATKLHALLCRPYAKGRDWYDFLWYVSRYIQPQFDLLADALKQVGPWREQKELIVEPAWLLEQLRFRIRGLDWKKVCDDVQRFLPRLEQESLSLWKEEFFLYHVEKMGQFLVHSE